MKLYVSGRAPNPRRVQIFLAEKGIMVPTAQIDIGRLEHKTDAFSSVNPMQRVPVLELDDGTIIAESIAICRYFEEVQPAPPLFGSSPVERAQVEMWQRHLEFELLATVAAVFRHLHPAMASLEVPQVAAWGEANKPRVERVLRVLDSHLAAREFVCGPTFTVADITGLVGIDFMKPAKLSVPPELEHVHRWRNALAARPSASA